MKRHLNSILLVSVIFSILLYCCGMGRITKERCEKIEQLSAPMTGIEKLFVDTSYGDIKIKGADTNDCNVSAKVTAQSPDSNQAKSLAEQTKITFEKEANTIFIRAQKPAIPKNPTTRVLNGHYPNANNPQLAIEYSIPEKGWTLVEILDQISELDEHAVGEDPV